MPSSNAIIVVPTISTVSSTVDGDGTQRVLFRSSGWTAVNKRAEPIILEEVYDNRGKLRARLWYEEVNGLKKIRVFEDHEWTQ